MTPHVHISPIHILATILAVLAIFGTLHLFALTSNDRASKALIALGF